MSILIKIIQNIEKISASQLQRIIVFIGLVIAAQVQYIQHGWINPDSILYFEAAKLFTLDAWHEGFQVFSWPFYSLCIAVAHKLTTLSIHHSAQLLNVIFYGIATFGFLKLIELGGGKQLQLIAGALVWLSAQYIIGGVLEMLLRDEGFWAFYLTSLVFFIRFYKNNQFKDAVLWQLFIIIATLFRIEAILFLILLPFILFTQSQKSWAERGLSVVKAHILNLTLTTLIIAVLFQGNEASISMLGRLNEIITPQLFQEFTAKLVERSSIMASQVLGDYLEEFAMQGLVLTFIYIMCVKIISATGLINIVFATLTLKQKPALIEKNTYEVLKASAFIALINMILIITKVFVLSSRYVLALSIILMIFSSFYLAELLKQNQLKSNSKKQWLVIALVIFMLLGAVKNILPKKPDYIYMQNAVSWLATDNTKQQAVFYDDIRLRYYAGIPFKDIRGENWQNMLLGSVKKNSPMVHYLALNISNQLDKEAFIRDNLQQYIPIKRFNSSNKNKYIVIYRLKDI